MINFILHYNCKITINIFMAVLIYSFSNIKPLIFIIITTK